MQTINGFLQSVTYGMLSTLPVMMSLKHVTNVYQACRWHPLDSWKADQIEPSNDIRDITRKAGIRKDLKLFVRDMGGDVAEAYGNNSFSSDIGIAIDPRRFVTKDSSKDLSDAVNFVIRHECAQMLYKGQRKPEYCTTS